MHIYKPKRKRHTSPQVHLTKAAKNLCLVWYGMKLRRSFNPVKYTKAVALFLDIPLKCVKQCCGHKDEEGVTSVGASSLHSSLELSVSVYRFKPVALSQSRVLAGWLDTHRVLISATKKLQSADV